MGINIPTREELVANLVPLEEIGKHFNADSLEYLSVDGLLQTVHEQAAPALALNALGGNGVNPDGSPNGDRYASLRTKFSQQRFLGVHRVPPFAPHAGGALYSPLSIDLVRAPHALQSSPLGGGGPLV